MIHPKTPSPLYSLQRKKRQTNSGRNLLQSAKTIQLDEKPTPKLTIDYDTSDTLGFFEAIEKEKAQAEMAKMLEKKKQCPIAPDALIPNSTLRSMFKINEIEPVKVKMFQLRLDILQNLENKTNKNINWQNDDDEWVELADPDADFGESSSKPPSAKKTKSVRPVTGTLVSSQQNTIPELFKQMKKERWWKLTDEDGNNNLRSMLMYLIDILKAKQSDSYPSACTYVVEIFRTYGIEPALVDQILSILLGHLSEGGENDPLNVHTVRAIAQFMIEKKDIIVRLLEFALQCKSNDTLQFETINAVKFITDVNSFEDIDLALNNMAVVRDAAEDTFSLKMIIERIKSKPRKTPSDLTNEATPAAEESEKVEETIHPLLKKISAEKWYPRDENPITLDSVLDAIIAKLPTASKNMLKALTGHIIQLHRLLGFSNEQFDRVANGIISLLSHTDADHRLIAATVLAELGRETKAVDIALLNSFTNDPRILVRTECCDALKRITGIMSDTVLKDCADDIPFLETLPEEGFSLKNYWNDKHRVLTPPVPSIVVEDEPVVPTDEKDQEIPYIDEDQAEKSDIDVEDTGHQPTLDHERTEDATILIRSRSQSPQIHDDPSHETQKHRLHPQNSQFSITPSLNSSTAPITPIQPAIRVEIRETTKLTTKSSPNEPKSRREKQPSDSHTPQGRRQPTIVTDRYGRTPNKTTLSDKSLGNRQPLLPPNPQMWQSYEKQRENTLLNNVNQPSSTDMHQDQMADSVQAIIDHHTNTMGYYRMRPNRRVLIPHKISFDMIFGDLSHITVNKKPSSQSPSFISSGMHLSDLNRNKRHLHEVEFVQLLSSLVIRAIQLHRKNEAFAPGSLASMTSSSMNFTDALTVSQMQLHSMNDFHQPSLNSIQRLPPISRARPSSAEAARMKAEAQSRATRAGVNLHKTRQMEDALSNLLKSNREQTRSTLISGSTPYSPLVATSYDSNEITHAWLLEQLLRSQGTPNAQNYIHQISRTYPKFTPLLYSRIPSHLIPVIWNDPVMRQLASIIGNQQDDLSVEGLSTRQHTKPSLLTFDDEHSSNFFDYSASSQILAMQQQQREENKNEPLPTVRGVKMRLPRHVLKFGFREIESDSSPEESLVSLRDESIPKARRRRIYMHLMCNHNCTHHTK